jgi:hypothetical protein
MEVLSYLRRCCLHFQRVQHRLRDRTAQIRKRQDHHPEQPLRALRSHAQHRDALAYSCDFPRLLPECVNHRRDRACYLPRDLLQLRDHANHIRDISLELRESCCQLREPALLYPDRYEALSGTSAADPAVSTLTPGGATPAPGDTPSAAGDMERPPGRGVPPVTSGSRR